MAATTTTIVITPPTCKGGACAHTTSSNAHGKKSVLAKRFKTDLCRSFEQTGRCPYVSRCMFAHGRRELRTAEQNVADGLTTEEAIKEWKEHRAEQVAARKKTKQPAAPAAAVASAARCGVAAGDSMTLPFANGERSMENTPRADSMTPPAKLAAGFDDSCGNSTTSSAVGTLHATPTCDAMSQSSRCSTPDQRAVAPRRWRHDPYAPVAGLPRLSASAASSPLAAAFGHQVRSL